MENSEAKTRLIAIQSAGYRVIQQLGLLIQQSRLVEAGELKNSLFSLFDQIGEIQNNMNKFAPCPNSLTQECIDGPEHVSAGFSNVTATSLRFDFEFDENRMARTCYYRGSDPSTVMYTAGDSSGNYGAPGNGHSQLVENLLPEIYMFISQTRDSVNDSWRNVSCPIEQDMSSLAELNRSTIDHSFWTDQGYSVEWSSTPEESDEGQLLSDYFQQDHWLNGNANQVDYSQASDSSNAVVISDDGVPSLRVIIPAGEYEGLAVRGNQFGYSGLDGKRCVVYRHRIYTPSVDDDGLDWPNTRESGLYLFSGHHQWSTPGSSANSSGATYYDNSATFRYTLNGDGNYHCWSYIAQHKASGAGRSIYTGIHWEDETTSFRENRIPLDLEVIRNSAPGVADGSVEMFVDEVSIHKESNLNIAEHSEQWAKGFGCYMQNRRMLNDQQIIDISDMVVFSKDID